MTRRPLTSVAAPVAALASAWLASGCAEVQKPETALPEAGKAAPAMEEAPGQATAAAQAAPARRASDAGSAADAKRLFEQAVAIAGSDPERAAGLFEKAFSIDPSLCYAAYDAGVAYERLGDLTRAREAYLRALGSAPDFEPASQNLTRLRLRTGKAEEAESDLRARIAANPDKVGLRNQLVEVLLATGRLEGAEQESRRVLKMDEQNVPALVNLATAYYGNGRYELAKMVLDNARQIDPKDAATWNRLGFVELALGDRPEALAAFEKAAALRLDYPEAHVNYGAMLVDAEDYPGAVKELELAVRHASASAAAHLNLGNAYRGAKQFDQAQREYEKALALDARSPDPLFNLGVLYLDGDKPGMAAVDRLQRSLAYFDKYAAAGGADPRLAQYKKDAAGALDREKRRLAREEKDRLRKEAEARKKAEPQAPLTGKAVKPQGAQPAPKGGTGGDK
ncbi:MAG TPA: tetratricopeptide repeat protein [Anaeromyxobacteraceae bacterium]|nr:tetratricopeptide repeat protein [Anaeromyxobacteraceae bacterium]